MPRKPIDYSNCCIYKIEHIENENLLYVGHTTDFNKRKSRHKKCCKNVNNKEFNRKLYQMIRENGGFEMFQMIEVEKYSCNDRREAEKRENEIMKELKANMNAIRSFRSEQEKKEQSKGLSKEYYEKNKEQIYKMNKIKYEVNKEDILKKNKEYYEEHKDKILKRLIKYNKEYYESKKEQILEKMKEKINCECGCEITKSFLIKHKETKKHINLMNKINS